MVGLVNADALETEPRQTDDGRVPLDRGAIAATALVAWLVVCWVNVMATFPFRGDDVANKDTHDLLAADGTTLWSAIEHWTQFWMQSQGRFFPGSVSFTLGTFYVADGSLATYRLVQAATLTAAIVTTAVLVGSVTGSRRWGLLTVPLILGFVQIRVWADAYTSYSGLLTLTLALSTGALLIVLARRRWPWLLLAGVMYAAAVVTYETVVLFAPVLAVIAVVLRRDWRPALPFVVPAALQTAMVLYLRASLTSAPVEAYTVSLELRVVLATTARQMAAALPMSQWIFGATAVPPLSAGALLLAALLAGVPATVVALRLLRAPDRRPRRVWPLMALGTWMWVSSSLLVGVTQRWQVSVVWGQGYLPVVFGQFGLALVLVALWARGYAWASGRGLGAGTAARWASSVALGVLVTLTLAGNLAVSTVEHLI